MMLQTQPLGLNVDPGLDLPVLEKLTLSSPREKRAEVVEEVLAMKVSFFLQSKKSAFVQSTQEIAQAEFLVGRGVLLSIDPLSQLDDRICQFLENRLNEMDDERLLVQDKQAPNIRRFLKYLELVEKPSLNQEKAPSYRLSSVSTYLRGIKILEGEEPIATLVRTKEGPILFLHCELDKQTYGLILKELQPCGLFLIDRHLMEEPLYVDFLFYLNSFIRIEKEDERYLFFRFTSVKKPEESREVLSMMVKIHHRFLKMVQPGR